MAAEATARAIGGELLVKFFDAIVAEQRKRWSAPDWRDREPNKHDLANWKDVAAALRSLKW